MALRESPKEPEMADLFRQELVNLISLKHPLVRLSQSFD